MSQKIYRGNLYVATLYLRYQRTEVDVQRGELGEKKYFLTFWVCVSVSMSIRQFISTEAFEIILLVACVKYLSRVLTYSVVTPHFFVMICYSNFFTSSPNGGKRLLD